MCGAVSTRGLHAPAPSLFDPFVYFRNQAKRKSLRRKDFTFAAVAGRGHLYYGCGVPRRRLVYITEPVAHTLPCGLAREGRVLFVRQVMWHACYSEHIRGRCGSILAGSYSCGRQWRWPWLGALLIVCRPTRAIKTRCQRPENLGEKLIQICTATVAALLLLLEFVLLREHPAFPVSFLRYSSSGRCAFSVGCISTWAWWWWWWWNNYCCGCSGSCCSYCSCCWRPRPCLPGRKPPPRLSRCSRRWASSFHNAFSVGMFVRIPLGFLMLLLLLLLLLSSPLEAVRRRRGRDS